MQMRFYWRAIKGKTSKLDLSTYKNDYEAAVKKTGRREAERKAAAGTGTRASEDESREYYRCFTKQPGTRKET
jgi:hypothetical protein